MFYEKFEYVDESDFYINQFIITINIVAVVVIDYIYLLGFQLTSEMPMLFKIKAVTCKAAFCKHGIAIGISYFFIHLSRILVPIGNAPFIIGTISALTFQIFSISIVKSCCFDVFHPPLEICLYHKIYLRIFYQTFPCCFIDTYSIWSSGLSGLNSLYAKVPQVRHLVIIQAADLYLINYVNRTIKGSKTATSTQRFIIRAIQKERMLILSMFCLSLPPPSNFLLPCSFQPTLPSNRLQVGFVFCLLHEPRKP